MPGRTPYEAVEQHLRILRQALRCVTQYRLALNERTRLQPDVEPFISLNDARPVSLRGQHDLSLRVGQRIRILDVGRNEPADQRYSVALVGYFYAFESPNGQEILAFHWTHDSRDVGAIRFPHAHIGPAITAGQTVLRPGDLHRAHIPTGIISLPAIIRLAISEFGVAPPREDWAAGLDAAETVLSAEPHA